MNNDEETGAATGGHDREATLRLGQQHFPLRDVIKEEIRRAILQGAYKPGERLVEDRLAEDFGVSRNPVREALRALAAEGLITVTARKGAIVPELSPDMARELIEVRATLEGLNARLAARRRDPEMLDRLQKIMEAGNRAMAEGRIDALRPLNTHFHDALAAAGSNRVLEDLMRSLRERSSVAFIPPTLELAERTWAEHADILKAVIAGDEPLATLMAERHVRNAGTLFLASLDK
jgi:DNA-binding GntR family transcriptional regulator